MTTTHESALAELATFDQDAVCSKCHHDVIVTSYQSDTSHYGCPIAKAIRTAYGPEHFSRCCQQCRYTWEERCL